jgi:UDP-glucose:(heptosyl)LPS alpha-1,3-glucosyltransferase
MIKERRGTDLDPTLMAPSYMPEPNRSVQHSTENLQIVFVRQQFSAFGGGERILDRIVAALLARGARAKLLGRSWEPRKGLQFIHCDPPKTPRFLREQRFARAACEILRSETGYIVQSHERLPCCDIFRAGEGSHLAYIEHRKRGLSRAAGILLDLHPFHRNIIALERDMFASPHLQAVMVNSAMVAEEIRRLYSVPQERLHLVPNGIDLDHFHPDARARLRNETRATLKADPSVPDDSDRSTREKRCRYRALGCGWGQRACRL